VDAAREHVKATAAMVQEVDASRARVTADIQRWESELQRMEALVNGRVIDTQTLDETRKQLKTATAGRDEIQAKIAAAEAKVGEAKAQTRKAEAEVSAAEARRRVALADVERTQALLGYTQIRAPFPGVVTTRHVDTGHFLQASNGKHEPLFVIARLDMLRVITDLPESAAEQAQPGQKAIVKLPTLGNREIATTITRTSGVVNPESRTQRIEIDLPNLDGRLKPGLYATIRISANTAEVSTLPATAILFADETAYAFLVQDGKVSKLRMQIGRSDNGVLEVRGKRKASDGSGAWQPVTSTDQFVTGNLGALADGQTVSIGQ
jgi:HlyD family secretion protein